MDTKRSTWERCSTIEKMLLGQVAFHDVGDDEHDGDDGDHDGGDDEYD